MRIKYLLIILVLLIAVLGLSYYSSLLPLESKGVIGEQGQYVIKQTDDEIIEEVEDGIKEEVIVSDELPKQEIVNILFNIFSPKTLTVEKGTRVTWVNRDKRVHMIKEISTEHLFRSGRINPGGSYSFTFNEPGEYRYIDTIQTYMQGKIIVEAPSLDLITGNFVGFSRNPSNVVTLFLFLALGLTIIYTIERRK